MAFNRTSEISEHGRRRSGLTLHTRPRTYDPRGSLKYRADAGSFRYSWPWGPDEENSSWDRGGGGGLARDLSFYYIASRRGEADAQLFMLVSRPIGRIGHIRTYLPRIRRACCVMVVVNGRGTRELRTRTLSSATLPHSSPCSSSLFLRSG